MQGKMNKKTIITMLTILVIFSVFIGTISTAYAVPQVPAGSSFEATKNHLDKHLNSDIATWAWEVACAASGCHPDYSFSTLATKIYDIQGFTSQLNIGPIKPTEKTSLIQIGASAYEYMKVIGIALIFLFFLIDLLDEVQADSFTIEHLIKKLITLTIAIVVVNIGSTLFDYICQFGDTMLVDVNSAVTNGGGEYITKANELLATQDDGFFSSVLLFIAALGMIVENLLGYILNLVAFIIAYLVAFSRFIEILVRFTFAPIGMAQLVSGGAKGPGMRYIKKFASCVLQGAVCVASFGAADAVRSASTGVSGVLAQVLVPITLIGFLMKTGRIADDVVGV